MSTPTHHFVDLVNGRFKNTTSAQMDDMFLALEHAAGKHLVVNFHGGLVSRASARSSMETTLLNAYRATGAWPYFFIWNSDLFTTIKANLKEIGAEPVFIQLVLKLIEYVSEKMLSDVAGRGMGTPEPVPYTCRDLDGLAAEALRREEEWRQSGQQADELNAQEALLIEKSLRADPILQSEARKIAAGMAGATAADRTAGGAAIARKTLMSPQLLAAEVGGGADAATRSLETIGFLVQHGLAVAYRVVRRFHHKRDHGLFNSIVEELLRELYIDAAGVLAWKMMKQDTDDAFADDPALHGGRRFAAALTRLMNNQPDMRVTLIGHSTGAIYITNLLKCMDSELAAACRFEVIFLAPAITMSAMADALDVYRRRVSGFRMFALSDQRETGYWEAPPLYKASLLYMVSGIFEEEAQGAEMGDVPLLGMQRHSQAAAGSACDRDGWRDLHGWLDLSKRAVWSGQTAAGQAGYLSDALQHGAIDDGDPKTLSSVAHILKHGFH